MINCTQVLDIHDLSSANEAVGFSCGYDGSSVRTITRNIAGNPKPFERLHTPTGTKKNAEASRTTFYRLHLNERGGAYRTTSGSFHLYSLSQQTHWGDIVSIDLCDDRRLRLDLAIWSFKRRPSISSHRVRTLQTDYYQSRAHLRTISVHGEGSKRLHLPAEQSVFRSCHPRHRQLHILTRLNRLDLRGWNLYYRFQDCILSSSRFDNCNGGSSGHRGPQFY